MEGTGGAEITQPCWEMRSPSTCLVLAEHPVGVSGLTWRYPYQDLRHKFSSRKLQLVPSFSAVEELPHPFPDAACGKSSDAQFWNDLGSFGKVQYRVLYH